MWERIADFVDRPTRDALRALAADPRAAWIAGRQGTGYEKLPLDVASEAIDALTAAGLTRMGEWAAREGRRIVGHDRYLLRYAAGTLVPPHRDPPLADGLRHLRLNAIIVHDGGGGSLRMDGVTVPVTEGDAVIFRPDLVDHEVTVLTSGHRLVWSVGCNY